MNWLNKQGVSTKLSLGFGIVTLLLLIQGLATFYQVSQIRNRVEEVTMNWLPSIEDLGDLESSILNLRISGFEFAATPDRLEEEGRKLSNEVEQELTKAGALMASAEEKSKFAELQQSWQRFSQNRDAAVRKRRAGGTVEEYMQLMQGAINDDFVRLEKNLDDLVKLNKDGATNSSNAVEAYEKFTLAVIIVLSVLAIIASLVGASVIARAITVPLNEALAMANRLTEGDLGSMVTSDAPMMPQANRGTALLLQQANFMAPQAAPVVVEQTNNEITKLTQAMNNMVVYLKDMANAANTIANGNLSIQVQPKSDRDVFGRTFNNMVKNLRNMSQVASSISEGNLNLEVRPLSDSDVFGNAFKKMVDNLRVTGSVADSIAKGDLTVKVAPMSAQDSFGNSFKAMVDSLRAIIRDLADGVQSLSSSAEELVAVSNSQSNNINEQASSTQEISTTVDEIRSIVEQTNDRAKDVVRVAEQSLDISETGQQELEQVVEAMGKIKDQVEEIAENILDLSEKTIQVGEITSSVNDIAEQSNLLAVNAAIEATKAGEAGKGFGVVAVEVKNLASRSKKATTQVRSILTEIQKSANSTVLVTEEGSKRVESGVDQVNRIGKNVKTLHEVILESSRAAKQIAASTNQQVSGIEQIVIAMKNINKITNESAAGAKQQKATAANLSQLANNLNHIVQRYRI